MTDESAPTGVVPLAELVRRWGMVEEPDAEASIARARMAIAEARELRERVMPAWLRQDTDATASQEADK